MAEFSIQKTVASLVDKYTDFDNKKNYEKQTAQIPPDKFYNNLLGAQLGGTSNLGATKVE